MRVIVLAAAASSLVASPSAEATERATAAETLVSCAAIGAAPDRLACYDRLAGRAPAPAEPPTLQPLVRPATPAPTTALAPKDAPAASPTPEAGLLSTFWELDPRTRRGVFNIVGYEPSYLIPLHLTNRINRAPASPTQASVPQPDYRHGEVKYQLSLRTKLVEELPGVGGDLWAAFTQQSFWQVYDAADSRPFRNTDYQPEANWIRPIPASLGTLPFGARWRYAQLGLVHQSNGQSDPLSRSWNRAVLGLGADRGDWAIDLKLVKRLFARADTDNNPDLAERRGRAEFRLVWAHGRDTALVELRASHPNLHGGSIRFEATTPIFAAQPNGVRWIFQAFSGYAETLTDYNFRQTSVGAGISFLQF